MTREEWLVELAGEIQRAQGYSRRITYLPSFPRRNARRVVLGELVRDADGQPLGLINPTISSSHEVIAVALYLMDRWRHNGIGERIGANPARWMSTRWFDPASGDINPREAVFADVDALLARMHERGLGDYPHAVVPVPERRTQTTRMIKVECSFGHDPYIVRMSQSQIDRGLPRCGVCDQTMTQV